MTEHETRRHLTEKASEALSRSHRKWVLGQEVEPPAELTSIPRVSPVLVIEERYRAKDLRKFVAENRERIDAEWDALPDPPRTIEAHLRQHAAEKGLV